MFDRHRVEALKVEPLPLERARNELAMAGVYVRPAARD
jgi:hypothetical protein